MSQTYNEMTYCIDPNDHGRSSGSVFSSGNVPDLFDCFEREHDCTINRYCQYFSNHLQKIYNPNRQATHTVEPRAATPPDTPQLPREPLSPLTVLSTQVTIKEPRHTTQTQLLAASGESGESVPQPRGRKRKATANPEQRAKLRSRQQ